MSPFNFVHVALRAIRPNRANAPEGVQGGRLKEGAMGRAGCAFLASADPPESNGQYLSAENYLHFQGPSPSAPLVHVGRTRAACDIALRDKTPSVGG
jgi:hypothetical protein